jgi:GrpB-like predicted nucleotidyltransferase (UPF0157 family)/ADP-ribose pyrophosphatase YjhB (NUDIX family)
VDVVSMAVRAHTAVIRRGQILMVRHVHDGRDYWTLPGGSVEPGELPEQAAARELDEETGIRPTCLRPLYEDDREACFVSTCSDLQEARVGFDPELIGRTQIIKAVQWFALEHVRDDLQVSRVLQVLGRDPGPSVGLRRGTVSLCPHDPWWREAFEVTRVLLLAANSEHIVAVEHVGSTAVPGLPAKPIIDLAVAIRTLDEVELLSAALEPHGWIDRGFINDRRDDYLLVSESSDQVRTHHCHVVAAGSAAWHEYLTFRDRLRTNEDLREAYRRLKERLHGRFNAHRPAYTAGKVGFITRAIG